MSEKNVKQIVRFRAVKTVKKPIIVKFRIKDGETVSFQAEDGIRDPLVTGVQTCALPIFQVRYRDGCARPRLTF